MQRLPFLLALSLALVIACTPLPVVVTSTPGQPTDAPAVTPTREVYPTPTPPVNVWLPGVDCGELARSLAPGFTLVNANPCLQRPFITNENEVSQAYPLGFEVVSEPGLTVYGGHPLVWYDYDQKAYIVEFTKNGTGNHLNGFFGYKLRGQHIPANTCAAIKLTGQSFFDDPNNGFSPDDLGIHASINNGVEEIALSNKSLPDYSYWEAFWPIFTTNEVNTFDVTFTIGQTWATSGGFAEIFTVQLLIIPPGFCDNAGVVYF